MRRGALAERGVPRRQRHHICARCPPGLHGAAVANGSAMQQLPQGLPCTDRLAALRTITPHTERHTFLSHQATVSGCMPPCPAAAGAKQMLVQATVGRGRRARGSWHPQSSEVSFPSAVLHPTATKPRQAAMAEGNPHRDQHSYPPPPHLASLSTRHAWARQPGMPQCTGRGPSRWGLCVPSPCPTPRNSPALAGTAKQTTIHDATSLFLACYSRTTQRLLSGTQHINPSLGHLP